MTRKITKTLVGSLRPTGRTIIDDLTGIVMDVMADRPPITVTGALTTDHPASSYGHPVLLLDGHDQPYGMGDVVGFADGSWMPASEIIA